MTEKKRKNIIKSAIINNKISDQEVTMTQIYTSGSMIDKKPVANNVTKSTNMVLQATIKKNPLSSFGSTGKL